MLGFHLSSSSLGRVVLSIKQELKLKHAIFIETASKVFAQFLFELPFLFIVHSTKRHYYLRVPMIKCQIKGFPNKKAHYLLVFETTTAKSYNCKQICNIKQIEEHIEQNRLTLSLVRRSSNTITTFHFLRLFSIRNLSNEGKKAQLQTLVKSSIFNRENLKFWNLESFETLK